MQKDNEERAFRPKGIRDIKITWKMLFSSLLPVAILLVVWLLMVRTTDTTKIGSALYDEIILSNNLIADILPPPEYIIEPYVTALEYITAGDESKRDDLLTYFKQLEDTYDERHAYWLDTLRYSEEIKQVFLTDAHENAERFFDIFYNRVVPAVASGDASEIKTAQNELDAAYTAHRKAIDRTVVLSAEWAGTVANNADSSERSSRTTILVIIISAAALSLAVSLVISQSMVRHIKYVSQINRKIADGELSAAVDGRHISSDEIGRLCAATGRILKRLNGYVGYIGEITSVLDSLAQGDMRITLTKDYEGEFASIKTALITISSELNNTMTAIKVSADQVNSGASQIADGAQTLAQGSSEQSESLSELVRSITAISDDSANNSENVRTAMEYVGQADRNVRESTVHMEELVHAMREINASANKISGIIKTIDDISFQTNILALNASVEAARAGSAGRGFSVVADEVRNLASKSAEAASQTSDLITDTIRAIGKGREATETTAGALLSVKEKTEKVETVMKKISEASEAQTKEIREVKERLTQISNIVQLNSATAEESAAISQELSAQAQSLHSEVGRFRLLSGTDKQDPGYLRY